MSILGFLDESVEFTPLEDWIGRQDMEKGKICLKSLELMNASIFSRNKERLLSFYKRNLDSNIECCTIILTEPTTPLIFMRNPVGLFYLWGVLCISIQNKILTHW